MPTNDELDPDRLSLLKQKLGTWFSWKPPAVVQTIGPFDPDVFEKFAGMHWSVANKCGAWLRDCSDEQILILVQNRKARPPGIGQADMRDPLVRFWSDLQAGEIAELSRISPPWYASGFGHPEHVADFAYWCRMPSFTVSELTCLSVGIGPAEFPGSKLADLSRSNERPRIWPAQQFLVQRYELLQRTFDHYRQNARVSPSRFLDWVGRFEFPVHTGFIELLRRFHAAGHDRVARSPSMKPDRREIDSVAQLFTAMAIDYLGYRPSDARSSIPKEIAELAASMGMTISDDTVRKYLKLGAKFIDPAWEPIKANR